jgi:membrane protein implicated in regulation of membrane protease activity
MHTRFDWLGLLRRALTLTGGAAVGFALTAWAFPLPPVQALLVMFSAGAFAQAAGVYWDERVQAKQSRGIPAGLIKMIGAEGQLEAPCCPVGRIRIGFERWDARGGSGALIKAGQRVVVRNIAGTTLIVEPL